MEMMAWRRWNPRGRTSFAADECPNAMVNVVVAFEQADPTTRKRAFGFDESKADIGTSQLQLSRLDCAPVLRTSPDSLTHIHSNCRGVVVQALIAIPRDADLHRRHASLKLVAGLCGASKQNKTTTNRALHARSCGVVHQSWPAAPH